MLAVIATLIGTSATIITTFLVLRGSERLPGQLMRLGLTSLICFFLYRGVSGARFLIVIFCGIGAVYAITSGELPLLALGGIYVFAGATLVFSPSVSAYFRFKAQSRDSS